MAYIFAVIASVVGVVVYSLFPKADMDFVNQLKQTLTLGSGSLTIAGDLSVGNHVLLNDTKLVDGTDLSDFVWETNNKLGQIAITDTELKDELSKVESDLATLNYDNRYLLKTGISNTPWADELATISTNLTIHLHDDRYHTKSDTTKILNGYLPISGGTLLGNLIGTSASFTSINGNLIGNVTGTATGLDGSPSVVLSRLTLPSGATDGYTLISDSAGNASWTPTKTYWTLNGDNLLYPNSVTYNIGIGTSAPTQRLHVAGNAYVTGSYYDSTNSAGLAGNLLTSTVTGTAWVSVADAIAAQAFMHNGNTFGDNAVLGTKDFYGLSFITNDTTRMTIDTSGNIGIATTDPAGYLVNVAGSLNVAEIRVNGTVLSPGSGSNWVVSGSDIYRLVGNVGVGLSNPSANLDIASNSTVMTRLTTYSDTLNSRYDARRARGASSSPQAVLNGNSMLDIAGSVYDGTQFRLAAGIQMLADGDASTNITPGRIVFRTTPNTSGATRAERMRITSDGNIGINFTAPTALLDLGVPSTTYNGEVGSLRLSLAADSTERLAIGWDDTLNTTGAAYFQAVDSGVEYRPIYLNPAGGGVVVGRQHPPLSSEGLTVYNGLTLNRNYNDALTNPITLSKTRSGAILQNNDEMGVITFDGFDGTNYEGSIYIFGKVDGTPANNDMPGRLGFYTRPAGGTVPLERITIKNDGKVGIGTTSPNQIFEVNGGIRQNTVIAKPTCDAAVRGTTWFTQGGAGVKDTFEVCAKDAADSYDWRAIY